jgi:ribosomal protein S18 acetylase RimI-like enzyme
MKNKSLFITIILSIIIGQLVGRFITPLFNLSSIWSNFLVSLVLVIVILMIIEIIVNQIKYRKIKPIVLNDISSLYKISDKEIDKASQVLADGFSEDPLMKNLFRGNNKQQGIQTAVKMFLKYYQKYGAIYADSKDIKGVIIIAQDKESFMSFDKMLVSGAIIPALKLIFISGFDGISRTIALASLDDLRKEYHQKNSFIYIQMLGVAKKNQGKGIGKTLLNATFEKSKQLKLGVYLETESENNVRFYNKLGFETIKEIELTQINQKMWTMFCKVNL